MNSNLKPFLIITFLVVSILFLVFYGMAMAKSVLAPIFLAIVLAMVLTPMCNFFEKHGINRGWAVFLSDLTFILVILGIFFAVGAEIQKLTQNSSSIQDQLSSLYSNVESFVESNSGYDMKNPFSGETVQSTNPSNNPSGSQASVQSETGFGNNSTDQAKQASGMQKGSSSGGSSSFVNIQNFLTSVLSAVFNSLTTLLIVIIYIFFMMLYKDKFEKGILYFVPEAERGEGKSAINDILKDAQQYLFGHVILITVLTVFYTIGFSIAGMKGAFTTALLASVLTLVPYIGTMIGNLLAIGIAFITTGSMSAVWIVIATVGIGQFFESYFLEPYIVGKRMNVNPLFTILSVTVGAAVWGVIGMIVFLPLFSFIKAIADHVPLLQPIGYFIGKEDISGEKESKWKKKIKNLFK